MLTPDDLRAVAETAAHHLEPGGVVLMAPDDLRENFEADTDWGGHEAPDGRAARYMSWTAPGPADTVYTDYAYMLRDRDGSVRVLHDRHVTGRLPGATWVAALEAAGLSGQVVGFEHSDVQPGEHAVVIGVKPR
jgi:hypothetical protein